MKQHKYTHLGQSPYQFVGYLYDPVVQAPDGSYSGGNYVCDHCGRPISHVFQCVSSDGKHFNLGSIHVEDLGDNGLTQAIKTKAQQIKSEQAREKRRIKALEEWEAEKPQREAQEQAEKLEHEQKLATIKTEYERVKPILSSRPHPKYYFAQKGKTLLDYLNYFLSPDSETPRWQDWKVISTLREAGANV